MTKTHKGGLFGPEGGLVPRVFWSRGWFGPEGVLVTFSRGFSSDSKI